MPQEFFDFFSLLFAFLAVSFLVAFFLKKYFKAQTFFHFISLLKTTKPLWVFDYLAKYKKFFVPLADLGLVFGFGTIAVDFLIGSKKKPLIRLIVAVFSFVLLSLFFYFFDALLGNAFSNGFLTKQVFLLMVILFALFGFSGIGLFFLIINTVDIIVKYFAGKTPCPGVAPLIPGVEIPRVPITPPLWVWIPLFLVLILHEAMHGILGRIAKIPFKSTGLLLFGFLPIGAFVEPDEKEVEKKTKKEKLRFFAAGVSGNVAAFAFSLALFFALGFFFTSIFGEWENQITQNAVNGVLISGIAEKIEICGSVFESPAFGQLEKNSKILKINEKEIKNSQDLFQELAKTKPNPVVFLIEKDNQIIEKSLTPNQLGAFGISIEDIPNKNYFVPENYKTYSNIKSFTFLFLYWFFLLNLLVSLANFLPIPVFDGGRMMPILLFPYLGFLHKNEKQTEQLLHKFFITILIVLVLINLLPLII